jgi:uncharacterized Zn-binding protein involved in type VI secretion
MALAASRIGDQFEQRCSVPTLGTGSPNVFVNQLANGTLGKRTLPYQERVPCPKCCKTFTSSIITGSSKVFVNGMSSSTLKDLALGITGAFPLIKGSPNVFMP